MSKTKQELTNQLLNIGKDIEQPNYNAVFVLNSIFCKSCSKLFQMQGGVVLALTSDELVIRAETEHNKKSVCPRPQLLIHYGTALLSETLFKELDAIK